LLAYQFSDYLQFVLSGLSTGCIYALIALAFVMIFSVTGIVNLAQGEFVMLGAMLAVVFTALKLPLGLSAVLSILCVTAIAWVIHRLTIVPARGASDVGFIIITIGTSITVRGLSLVAWGTTPYALPEFTPGPAIRIAGAIMGRQRLWIIIVTAVVLLLLYLFLDKTLLGKALRACSINKQSAQAIGVNTHGMGVLSYMIGGALGAVAGIVIAPLTLVSYDMGVSLGLKGFIAAIMGGMISPVGAVIGGVLLGLIESLSSAVFSSGVKEGIAYAVLFAVLVGRTIWRAGHGRRDA